jgi:hypothetical protein
MLASAEPALALSFPFPEGGDRTFARETAGGATMRESTTWETSTGVGFSRRGGAKSPLRGQALSRAV